MTPPDEPPVPPDADPSDGVDSGHDEKDRRDQHRLDWARTRRRSRIAGVLLLAIGILWLAFSLGIPQSTATSSSLNQTLSLALQIVQHALLAGDRALSDTQQRFNSVVVAVFIDQLNDTQRLTLNTATGAIRMLLTDLLSPLGLLTVVGLLVLRGQIARAIDARYPRGLAHRSPTAPNRR